MRLSKRDIFHIVLTIALMVFIFVQSALPADLSQNESNFLVPFICKLLRVDAETASFFIRKLAHFTEYTLLGMCLMVTVRNLKTAREVALAEKNGTNADRKRIEQKLKLLPLAGISWLIGMVYAVSDEIHQMFVSGRSCEFRDMLIDFGGVLLGVMLILIVKTVRQMNQDLEDLRQNSTQPPD